MAKRPPNPGKSELTLKQARFVRAYLETGNGTEAARRAGYDGDDATLSAISVENLRKPRIVEAINTGIEREEREHSERVASKFELKAFWSKVQRGEVTDDPKSLAQRLKATELLARSKGMFVERRELTGKDGGPVETTGGLQITITDAKRIIRERRARGDK